MSHKTNQILYTFVLLNYVFCYTNQFRTCPQYEKFWRQLNIFKCYLYQLKPHFKVLDKRKRTEKTIGLYLVLIQTGRHLLIGHHKLKCENTVITFEHVKLNQINQTLYTLIWLKCTCCVLTQLGACPQNGTIYCHPTIFNSSQPLSI